MSACASLRAPSLQTTVLNGAHHWYSVAGAATSPTLIFVHGGPCGSSYQFERGAGAFLERDFRVIYYDQRACGRSERVAADTVSMQQLVKDLEELRAQHAPNQVVLLGSSFGGEIAMEYALRHPQHVSVLALEGSSVGDFARMARQQITKLQHDTEAMSHNTEDEFFVAWKNAGPSTVDRLLFHQASKAHNVRKIWSEETWNANVMVGRRLLTEKRGGDGLLARIRALRVPTLVLVGRHDFNTGLEMSRDIARAIPGAKLLIFENSAHFVHSEEPEKYRDALLRFTKAQIPRESGRTR